MLVFMFNTPYMIFLTNIYYKYNRQENSKNSSNNNTEYNIYNYYSLRNNNSFLKSINTKKISNYLPLPQPKKNNKKKIINKITYKIPEKFTVWPWVKWPPWSRLIAINVSPGFITAKYAAIFALEPEWGWTFAKLALNNWQARSIANASITSTFSHPP